MNIDFNQFATLVMEWCPYRSNDFTRLFPLKGGWEAWAQADWASYAIWQNSTYDILREQPVYANPQQRCDWLLNSNAVTPWQIVLELKCQSLDNQNNFIPGLQADLLKVQQGNLKMQYQGCQTGVMGLCFEQAALTWMQNNGFIIVYQDTNIACGIHKVS